MNNGNNLKDGKVIKKQLQAGRWFVILEFPRKYKKKIPGNPMLKNEKIKISQSHYNWLIGNPSFVNVPQGYVIHHLNGDKLNDDVSNLALMNRTHHMAHHAKQIPIDPVEIEVKGFRPIGNDILGVSPGKFWHGKKIGGLEERWFVRWNEGPSGNKYGRKISKYKGKPIRTEEQALKVMKELDEIKQKNELEECT